MAIILRVLGKYRVPYRDSLSLETPIQGRRGRTLLISLPCNSSFQSMIQIGRKFTWTTFWEKEKERGRRTLSKLSARGNRWSGGEKRWCKLQFTRKSMVEPILISSLVAVSTKGRTVVSLNWNMKREGEEDIIIIGRAALDHLSNQSPLSLSRVVRNCELQLGDGTSLKTIASNELLLERRERE